MATYGICDFCEGEIPNCPYCKGKGGFREDDDGYEMPVKPLDT